MSRLLFVDTETTGLTYDDRVITLGMVTLDLDALKEGRDAVQLSHLIFNPGRPSNPFAAAVHGYQDWVLTSQPHFALHAEDILPAFTAADIVLAHNAAFDERFLRTEFRMAGYELPAPRFDCTLKAYKRKHQRPGGLDKVLEHMGLSARGKQHGALEDAWFCMLAWLWLNDLEAPTAPAALTHPPSNWVEPGLPPIRGARKPLVARY
ncbi:3'-5' exonuclease [Rhizobium sp. TRM95796]|uniref:3'-5' exonuclease n=1 Tax=Rhizobium sp. TRM95796 TaxID=2979862 RepID=UPI0021E70EFC|nr:3'-5' exonuclease [Rhizobium sp. TRM95796]MCV3768364.1 3'-5' exonuclease [Rhizobium sp. TRM95796]